MSDKLAIDPQLAERLHQQLAKVIAERRRIPESTYRLQFHAGFTFRDAARVTPYLRALGVTHCYASPYLKARPGSTHGYDIVDHGSLNPEIGTEDDFNEWLGILKANGMSHILDVVPNHMGVATNDNAWWNDVLENGPASRFAAHFDIAWHASARSELQNKVLLPVLGEPYGEALESGLLLLAFDKGAFAICYGERRFPINPSAFGMILGHRIDELARALGPDAPAFMEYQSILTSARNLPPCSETEPGKIAERGREKEVIKRRLAALATDFAQIRDFIDQNRNLFNGQPGNPRSFDLLHDLLENQCFRLSYWRVALDEINYRRFFDINDLAALSIEREEVFTSVHALVLRLGVEGKIDGLRIDHPDGLYDPAQYFRRIQEHYIVATAKAIAATDSEFSTRAPVEADAVIREVARSAIAACRDTGWPLYVVAEKILANGEQLAEKWAIQGTSGYDFLNAVNGLFVDRANENGFTEFYHDLIGDETRFPELAYRKKLLILQASLASELHMLTHQLDRLAQQSRGSRDYTFNTLRLALRAVIACFPVYRSYIAAGEVNDDDRRNIQLAVRRATIRNPLISRRVFQFVRGMLLLDTPASFSNADQAEQRQFAGKFQQVTAPVTAKGIEDTSFYLYNRLISMNEVGGDPTHFGDPPEMLHANFRERQAKWPFALSALSTHDTKRSEDVRARLNVLSELPDLWRQNVERWMRMNRQHRQLVDDRTVPSANEEYLLYQALVGAWPLEMATPEERADFARRINAFMEKANREAKEHTSWINPNAEYDRAVTEFVSRVLDENLNRGFLEDFRPFQQRISHVGMINSLAQTVIKLTAPGVPDTYQGTEIWDFSLVDPDNRRAVDFGSRQAMLEQLQSVDRDSASFKEFVRTLLAARTDGRIKMYVTAQALRYRCENPGLFSNGKYLPLKLIGDKSANGFAFARSTAERWAMVVVPRLIANMTDESAARPFEPSVWGDTQLCLDNIPRGLQWRNVFTNTPLAESKATGERTFNLSELLVDLPVALLVSE